MTLEQTKAAINYLISEAKSSHEERALKSAFRMVEQLAEEKSGDEGALNEDSVHGAIANILDMNDDVAQHMDITIKGEPTVLVSYLKDLISRHPTPKEAPEGLYKAIEDYASDKNCIQPIVKKELKAILSRYRPAPDRTGELVKRLKYEADLYAEMPTSTMDTAEYERTKGIAQGLYKAAEIVRDFEGGA